jgi:translation initiation factor 2 alpha subunit (eIF-2alpha)
MVYYYKKKIPSVDDVVIAKVLNITEYGVYVSLNEFNNIKGFINCTEISRKKKVNMNKLLKIGKDVLLIVININENGFIDLSKRSINDEEIKIFGEKNKIYHQLYNIFKHVFIKIKKLDKIILDKKKEVSNSEPKLQEKIISVDNNSDSNSDDANDANDANDVNDHIETTVSQEFKVNNFDKNNEFQKLINEDELYSFMCSTLWQIQEHYETNEILDKILSKNFNRDILQLINFNGIDIVYNDENPITIDSFKSIIDNYIDTKLNRVKPTISETIKLKSFCIDGVKDIKYALDFESFPNIQPLLNDFEIKISYIASSQYSIEMKQKDYFVSSGYKIDDALKFIINEIGLRAKEKNVQIN